MKNKNFSESALRELIAQSATFSHFFGDSLANVTEYVLKLPQAEQERMFAILLEEDDAMEKIDQEYKHQEEQWMGHYLVKIDNGKAEFIEKLETAVDKAPASEEKEKFKKSLKDLG